MDDIELLNDAVIAYDKLLNKKYSFEFGKKNEILKINLIFLKENFFHIAGLHKLKDISLFKKTGKSLVFDMLFKGNNALIKQICSSCFYNDIKERLISIIKIDYNLKNSSFAKYIKFCANTSTNNSQIIYDYIFIYKEEDDQQIHYFLVKKKDLEYVISSTFINDTDLYWKNQKKLTLLSIDLIENNMTINLYKNNKAYQ